MDRPGQSLGARGGRICCRITAFWKSFGWSEPISGVILLTVLYSEHGLYTLSQCTAYSVQHSNVHNSPYLQYPVYHADHTRLSIVALLGKDISRIQPDSVTVIEEPIIHALFLCCHRQEDYQRRYAHCSSDPREA